MDLGFFWAGGAAAFLRVAVFTAGFAATTVVGTAALFLVSV